MPVKLPAIIISLFLTTHAQSQQLPGGDVPRLPEKAAMVIADSVNAHHTDSEPGFPGGTTGWRNYLLHHLKATVPVDNKAPRGTYTVIVKFMVAANGGVSDISTETNHGYGMEKEVIRLIKKGPSACLPVGRDTCDGGREGGG